MTYRPSTDPATALSVGPPTGMFSMIPVRRSYDSLDEAIRCLDPFNAIVAKHAAVMAYFGRPHCPCRMCMRLPPFAEGS